MPEERVLQQGHMEKRQDTGVWLLAVHFYILTSTHHLHHQFSDGHTFHTLMLFLKDSNLCRDVWPPPLNATFRNDKPSRLKIGVNRHIQENITHDQSGSTVHLCDHVTHGMFTLITLYLWPEQDTLTLHDAPPYDQSDSFSEASCRPWCVESCIYWVFCWDSQVVSLWLNMRIY